MKNFKVRQPSQFAFGQKTVFNVLVNSSEISSKSILSSFDVVECHCFKLFGVFSNNDVKQKTMFRCRVKD